KLKSQPGMNDAAAGIGATKPGTGAARSRAGKRAKRKPRREAGVLVNDGEPVSLDAVDQLHAPHAALVERRERRVVARQVHPEQGRGDRERGTAREVGRKLGVAADR